MINKVQIKSYQSLPDIQIQEYGNMLHLFDLAVDNDISITSDLTPGNQLLLSPAEDVDLEVLNYFNKNSISVSSFADFDITTVQLPTFESVSATIVKDYVASIKGQSVLDLALQETGQIDSLFEILTENNISVSSTISPGSIFYFKTPAEDIEILSFYKKRNIKPATVYPIESLLQTLFEAGLFETGLFE
jgi:hypothetical protein